jgi:hypothetical protein
MAGIIEQSIPDDIELNVDGNLSSQLKKHEEECPAGSGIVKDLMNTK